MIAGQRRVFTRTIPLLLCWLSIALSACASLASTPEAPDGQALPTSRVEQKPGAPLSVRFVQRLEEEKNASAHGPLQYGSGASLYGDTAAVGASESLAMDGYRKGMVFVYQRDGEQWALETQLLASDREDSAQVDPEFGSSVALYENTLAVGAPGADDGASGQNTGAVYIFQRGEAGWVETAILKASDSRAEAAFGTQLRLSGDTLVVGEGYPGQAVSVFERQGNDWLEQARLAGENMGEKDWFGYSLALDQDRLAVIAWHSNPDSGRIASTAIHLYYRQGNSWALETKLTQEVSSGIGYASSLDLEGDTLVVGSGDASAGITAGAVVIYTHGAQGWQQQARLVPADGAYFTALGSSVDLEGDLLLAGAGGDSSDTFWAGSAYLFARSGDTWIDLLKLRPFNEDQGDSFGASVILSGSDLLVSAPDEFGGPVYLYKVER